MSAKPDEPDANRRLVSGRPEQIAADSANQQQEAMERFAREVMPLIPAD